MVLDFIEILKVIFLGIVWVLLTGYLSSTDRILWTNLSHLI